MIHKFPEFCVEEFEHTCQRVVKEHNHRKALRCPFKQVDGKNVKGMHLVVWHCHDEGTPVPGSPDATLAWLELETED